MSEPKIKPSDLRKQAQAMIRDGSMPSLETLLQAVADTREKYSGEINDPVLSELSRLGIATPIPPKSVNLGPQSVDLSESERVQLARTEGQQLYERVASVVNDQLWQEASNARKIAAIKKWRNEIARSRPSRLIQIRGPIENWLPDQPVESSANE
jgi:hypothetical protein